MIGNEAAIGVIYSGEAIYTQRENPDLEYVIPKEGTNVWIDSWVIPKNAPNKENAEKFIDFMCREDIALMNFEYITYSTPNVAAQALIEDEDIKNSKIAFPDLSQYDNLETFHYLGEEGASVYPARRRHRRGHSQLDPQNMDCQRPRRQQSVRRDSGNNRRCSDVR